MVKTKRLIATLVFASCAAGCGYETLTTTTPLVPLPFISTVGAVAASDHIAYLQNNSHELHADVTLGDGERLRELAFMTGVAGGDYREFAREVRRRRAELKPLLQEPTEESTVTFFAIIDECADAASDSRT